MIPCSAVLNSALLVFDLQGIERMKLIGRSSDMNRNRTLLVFAKGTESSSEETCIGTILKVFEKRVVIDHLFVIDGFECSTTMSEETLEKRRIEETRSLVFTCVEIDRYYQERVRYRTD